MGASSMSAANRLRHSSVPRSPPALQSLQFRTGLRWKRRPDTARPPAPSSPSCLLSSCAPTGSPPAGVPARRMLTVSTTLSAALMAAPTSVLAEVLSLLIPDHRPTPARPLLLHLQSSPRRNLQRRFPPTWPPISWPQVLRCPLSLQ